MKTKKEKALTIAEQETLLWFLKTDEQARRWYPLIKIALSTGLRCGELIGLRWEDLDLVNNTISVNHTLVYYDHHRENLRCGYGINTPKTKAGYRLIPITNDVKEAISERLLLLSM